MHINVFCFTRKFDTVIAYARTRAHARVYVRRIHFACGSLACAQVLCCLLLSLLI